MARHLRTKARFERAYRRLGEAERSLVDQAIRRFSEYLDTGSAPAGLGLKKLGPRTFEFRAGLALRVVYVADGDTLVFHLLGGHDAVRKFLRHS